MKVNGTALTVTIITSNAVDWPGGVVAVAEGLARRVDLRSDLGHQSARIEQNLYFYLKTTEIVSI